MVASNVPKESNSKWCAEYDLKAEYIIAALEKVLHNGAHRLASAIDRGMGVSASASGCLLSARPGGPLLRSRRGHGPPATSKSGQKRDIAQVDGSAGIPLDSIAGASGRHGHVRAERDVAGVEVLLGG